MAVSDANIKVNANFNGADGATSFTDALGTTFTAHGAAALETTGYLYAPSSGLIPSAAADYFTTSTPGVFDIGAGDFAIEVWFSAVGLDTGTLVEFYDSTSGKYWRVSLGRSGGNRYPEFNTNSVGFGPSISPWGYDWATADPGVPQYVCFEREGSTIRCFYNTLLHISTYGDSSDMSVPSTGEVRIGARPSDPTTNLFTGTVGAVRVTKGGIRNGGSGSLSSIPDPYAFVTSSGADRTLAAAQTLAGVSQTATATASGTVGQFVLHLNGDSLTDLTGRHTLIANDGTVTFTGGRLNFNQASSLRIDDNLADFSFPGSFTIEGQFSGPTAGAATGIILSNYVSTGTFQMFVRGASQSYLGGFYGEGGEYFENGVWVDGTVKDFAFIYDAATGVQSLYLNGTRISTSTGGAHNYVPGTAPSMYIGRESASSTKFLLGTLRLRINKGAALYSGTSYTPPTWPITSGVDRSAVAAQTLATVTQTATATNTDHAVAAQTLGSVTQTATATNTPHLTAAQTLGSVTQTATGTVTFPVRSAVAAQTLGSVTQTAAATVAFPTRSAVAAQTLATVTQTATATNAGVLIGWDPAYTHANIALSNSNTRATKTTNDALVTTLSNKPKASGKWYFEVAVVASYAPAQFKVVGVATTSLNLGSFPGSDATSWGYYQETGNKFTNNVGSAYGINWSVGAIGVAVDLDNGKIWFSREGVWQASGDPTTGLNPAFTGLTGTLRAATALYTGTQSPFDVMDGLFAKSAQTYTAPVGFAAWDELTPATNGGSVAQTLGSVTQSATATVTSVAAGFDILTHLDGTNGGTTFVEEHGKTVTRNGTGITTSTAQAKFGQSGSFPGTSGNSLTIPVTKTGLIADFSMGGWFWVDPAWSGSRAIATMSGVAAELYLNGSNQLTFWGGSSNLITGLGTVSAGWHFGCIERVGSTATLTLDGVVQGTATYSGGFTSTTLYIGSYTSNGENFLGYLDEVFLYLGGTLYGGAAFTPPTGPFTLVPVDRSLAAAQTLATVTQSAAVTTGPAPANATATQTLATVTQTAAFTVTTVLVSAQANQTLLPVSQAATASVSGLRQATAAQTLADVTQTATVTTSMHVEATQTLADVTQSAVAVAVPMRYADASQGLASVTQAATLSALASLTSARTLDSVTQSATTHVEPTPGYSAQQFLDYVSTTATAKVSVAITQAKALEGISQAATARVLPVLQATGTQILDSVAHVAALTVLVKASGSSTLATVAQNAQATLATNFAAAQTLANILQVATGTVFDTVWHASATQVLSGVSQRARIQHEYVFEANIRTWYVSVQYRTYGIDPQIRSINLEPQARGFASGPQDRLISIDPQNRGIAVTAQGRTQELEP